MRLFCQARLLFPRAMSQSHACMTLTNAARVNTPPLGALQFPCPTACGGVIDCFNKKEEKDKAIAGFGVENYDDCLGTGLDKPVTRFEIEEQMEEERKLSPTTILFSFQITGKRLS